MPPTKMTLPKNPDVFGPSLAHVVLVKPDSDEVLGQAWLAAPNTLITCGHVVDQFTRSPASLTVKFPASGNRYVIREIKLHPSFQHHKGELVRFDLATLTVDLIDPDSSARPLPIIFEKPIDQHQQLTAIRYPSHLGLYTTSLSPLAQNGSYLGPLKRHDRFHLLHDLALAPGDSGTPLFDGESVVAIHCGDTATLPGLNLATTSIRLALSVDSLMALGISESAPMSSTTTVGALLGLIPGVIAFVCCFIITLTLFALPHKDAWSFSQTPNIAVDIAFNKGLNEYKYRDPVSITMTPKVDCDLFCFYIEGDTALMLFPPPNTGLTSKAERNHQVIVHHYGVSNILVSDTPGGKFHFVALISGEAPVKKDEMAQADSNFQLPIKGPELLNRIISLKIKSPDKVLHEEIDAPSAPATK